MTVLMPTPTVTDRVPSASETRSASKRHTDSQPQGGSDVGPVPFDVLLQASRVVSAGTVGTVDANVSPSLMFEPAAAQRRPGGRSGAEAGDQSGDRLAADRYDRTSISSRRSQVGSRSDRAPLGESGADKLALNRNANVRDGSLVSRVTFDEASSSGSRQTPAGDYAAHRSVATNEARPEAPATVTSSGASAGVSRVPSGAESVRAPAMLVGRLLATGQGGDADGLRGTAQAGASATETNARSTEPSDTASSRSQTARQAAGQGAASTGSADRVKGSMFEQLVQSIRLSADGRKSSVRMQLNPPELGRMDVEVRVDGERVRIDVRTQSDEARLLVQERSSELIASLKEQGITVERIEVGTESVGQGLGWSGDPGTPDGAAAQGANRFSGNSHSDPNASEDASSRPVEPVQQAGYASGESELAVVAESRLDIRV